jgi:hypothetical protein
MLHSFGERQYQLSWSWSFRFVAALGLSMFRCDGTAVEAILKVKMTVVYQGK